MFRRRRVLLACLTCLFVVVGCLLVRWFTRPFNRMRQQFEQVQSLHRDRDNMALEEVTQFVGLPPGDYSSAEHDYGTRGFVRGMGSRWELEYWRADDAELEVVYDPDNQRVLRVEVHETKGGLSEFTSSLGRWLGR